MSLILELKITPGKTNWAATAKLSEDNESSAKEIYCQKELAWKMKLTGDEVTAVMMDMGMSPSGSCNTWVSGYYLTIDKSSRVIALSTLKSSVIALVTTLRKEFGLDVIVYTYKGTERNYAGSVSSSSFLTDIEEWNG